MLGIKLMVYSKTSCDQTAEIKSGIGAYPLKAEGRRWAHSFWETQQWMWLRREAGLYEDL